MNTATIGATSTATASSALEQLDIERGVCIPFRKYTPHTVRNKVLESRGAILSLIARGIEIVWNLGFYWSTLMYDFLVGRDEEVVPYRARQLRNLLCDLGPSFIKAGQVLANRPDIIREDYMNELCILQDDVPPFPNQVAFNIIEEELGQPLEAIFSKISSETIAAASLGQVYRATLRVSGEDVAIKVQRPEIEPIIYRDLFLFRTLASFLNGISLQKLGCNAELIVDEFGEKLLEELDYTLEARNIEDFLENFKNDPTVKIPMVYKQLSGSRVLVMEWIDGIRCTDPQAIKDEGIDVNGFLTVGVSAALRQLLEFGLFHGDPHPGNIFAMRDGRIAYVDFGNVAVLSQQNKQILIDAVVHAVNEDYVEMANDFTRLGFLASGTDVAPIIPALEAIWQNSAGKGVSDFNFRSVTVACTTARPPQVSILDFSFSHFRGLLETTRAERATSGQQGAVRDNPGQKGLQVAAGGCTEQQGLQEGSKGWLASESHHSTLKITPAYHRLITAGPRALTKGWQLGYCFTPNNAFPLQYCNSPDITSEAYHTYHCNLTAMWNEDCQRTKCTWEAPRRLPLERFRMSSLRWRICSSERWTHKRLFQHPLLNTLAWLWDHIRKFNQLVYQYPIRIPERFSLVIRSLLTQEGICFTLKPDFKFLEVAYPYVAKRLLTDPNPALRERLIQVLFKDGVFQWETARKSYCSGEGKCGKDEQLSREWQIDRKLDLTDTIKDGARLFLIDEGIRKQLLLAMTEDSKLHIQELVDVYRLVEDQIDIPSVALEVARDLPSVARDVMLSWSNSILSDR
ncbi:protein kinase superfamily protein [Actinidia rufa]|uniref:Protein kinase superfamily protein n=1 Tax=Actinidia rufa TaxID=165716 RepID=A0A7J0DUK9_9ERIC|nr:protein kinase superfamily protein [Actinidia rufa]